MQYSRYMEKEFVNRFQDMVGEDFNIYAVNVAGDRYYFTVNYAPMTGYLSVDIFDVTLISDNVEELGVAIYNILESGQGLDILYMDAGVTEFSELFLSSGNTRDIGQRLLAIADKLEYGEDGE